MIERTPLRDTDRTNWQRLAVAYNAFYERILPDASYDRTWHQLLAGHDICGLAARHDGRIVGIAHYLFHTSVWFEDVCYLADLYVEEAWRGQGIARSLIEVVARTGQGRGATRLYWLTNHDNERARLLYDKIGQFSGFICYDYSNLPAEAPSADPRVLSRRKDRLSVL